MLITTTYTNLKRSCTSEGCVPFIMKCNVCMWHFTPFPFHLNTFLNSNSSPSSDFFFSSSVCLQLYVQARMQGKWTRLVRPTIQFFLVAFAFYVGYTRVSDYKHHWSDVLIGLLQGALIAVLNVSPTVETKNEALPFCVKGHAFYI